MFSINDSNNYDDDDDDTGEKKGMVSECLWEMFESQTIGKQYLLPYLCSFILFHDDDDENDKDDEDDADDDDDNDDDDDIQRAMFTPIPFFFHSSSKLAFINLCSNFL